jgi:hypothetical protein
LHLNSRWALQLGYKNAAVSGADSYSTQEGFRVRNLSFESKINELQASLRYYPLGYIPEQKRWSPYFFTGVTLFHFNPMAEYQGNWVELQPLGTEGQGTSAFPDRKPYRLTQIAVPLGGGVKYLLSPSLAVGVEGTLQVTFTDYLDDLSNTYVDPAILIAENGLMAYHLSNRTGEYLGGEPTLKTSTSPRGNPDVNDYYGYFGVTFSFIFPSGFIESAAAKRANIGCGK